MVDDAPLWVKNPPPMPSGNVAKMQELYPEEFQSPAPANTPPSWVKTPLAPPIPEQPIPLVMPANAALQPPSSPPAAPGWVKSTVSELGKRESEALSGYLSDIPTQVTKPFQKDTSAGPEWLQRVGDIGGRIGGAVGDIAGAVFSPVESGIKTTLSKTLPEQIQGDKREKLVQDIGDVATMAVLPPAVKELAPAKTIETIKNIPKQAEAIIVPELAGEIKSPAIRSGGRLFTGENHEAIKIDAAERIKGKPMEEGFITTKGQFVTREDAAKIAESNGQAITSKEPGKLHSEDLTLNKVSDDLFKISNADKADRIELANSLKTIQGVNNSTWEKLYAHMDNPKKVQLTPQEQGLFDNTIKPMDEERRKLYSQIKDTGYDLGELSDTGAAPRQVAGKGGPVDRLTGMKSVPGRKNLSTTAGALKERSMFAVEDKQGNRQVVHVDNGNIYPATKEGRLPAIGTVESKEPKLGQEITINGKPAKLVNATTDEIEKATNIQYHKNLLANEVTSLLQLRRAKRNIDFIENLKKDPDFINVAHPIGTKVVTPADWREVSNLPQFRGYRFKPEVAEALEDYIKDVKSYDDLATKLYKIGQLTKASIFYNPVPHMRNAANFYFVSKGLLNTIKDLPTTAKVAPRAIRAVMTQNKEYLNYLKEGVSLPGAENAAREMQKELIKAMGMQATEDPASFMKIAKNFGYDTPKALVAGVYRASNKALWSFSDMLTLTRVMEEGAKGLSRAKAIESVERIMPNYRVPTRVAGSRILSQTFQNPVFNLFGRYQYNRMKSYANMAKDMVQQKGVKNKLEAADRLAMIAFLQLMYYPIMDKAYRSWTGNEDAEVRRPGLNAPIQAAQDIGSGRKTPSQAAQSLFTPGLLQTPIELLQGRTMYTGQPITQPGDWANLTEEPGQSSARIGYDLAKYLGGKFAPVYEAEQLASGKMDPMSFWLSQIGVNAPSDEQLISRQKAEKYKQKEAKSAAKKRPDFVP